MDDSQEKKYKKFGLYKLVRQKTAEQMQSIGVLTDIQPVSRGKYLYKLKYKLIEEAKEVLRTKNKKELVDELGDVLEVFHLILNENRISMSEVLKAMQQKQTDRGPIQNLFLSILSIPEGHELVAKYEGAGYKLVE